MVKFQEKVSCYIRLYKAKASIMWAEKQGAQWITAEIADNLSAYIQIFVRASMEGRAVEGILLYQNA